MWLEGLEPRNRNAHSRLIYIHGTAEERTIGTPASYGCVRMKSNDVYEAFNLLRTGDPVVIERCSIDASLKALAQAEKMQDSSLLVMASAPDRMENANTASVISHRRRASRPPPLPFPASKRPQPGRNPFPPGGRSPAGRPEIPEPPSVPPEGPAIHSGKSSPSLLFFRSSVFAAS